ncbi:MAG: hypothetical protein HRU05_17510 [Oceanospirillaceae bacterium]|nr:hypothetical protein [Oceanospirillaceae bacterium]
MKRSNTAQSGALQTWGERAPSDSGRLLLDNPIKESVVFVTTLAFIFAVDPHKKKRQKTFLAHQGGTWSGKTYSIIQALVFAAIAYKYYNKKGKREPLSILIVGQDVPNLKKGAIKDFESVIRAIIDDFPPALRPIFEYKYNKTDKIATFNNGATIGFASFKDGQDAKSGKRHITFVNEANGIGWAVAEQLEFRSKVCTIIDYNSDAPFWYHHKMHGKSHVQLCISNFTHNPGVDEKTKRELIAKGRHNPEWRKVYINGQTGSTEAIIYPNVTWVDQLPESSDVSYGLDFGFSNSKTAFVKCVVSDGRLYVQLLFYATGLLAPDIAKEIEKAAKRHGLGNLKKSKKFIMADAASPDTIAHLRRLGYKRVIAARKGPNSVRDGIALVKSFEDLCIVDNPAFRLEQQSYKYLKDPMTGELTNEPDKKIGKDHAMDAMRYAIQGLRYTNKMQTN